MLLSNIGLETPEIFVDSNLMEIISNRDENNFFNDTLENVKNAIYKNIYNNMTNIYKSKGSMKSFRNLIRSFNSVGL